MSRLSAQYWLRLSHTVDVQDGKGTQEDMNPRNWRLRGQTWRLTTTVGK